MLHASSKEPFRHARRQIPLTLPRTPSVRDSMRRAGNSLATSCPFLGTAHCVGSALRISPNGKPSKPERGDVKSVQSSNDPETCPRQHALGEGPWGGPIDSPARSHTRLPPYGSSRSREELRFPTARNRVVPEPFSDYRRGTFPGSSSASRSRLRPLRDQPRPLPFPAPMLRARPVDIIDSCPRFLKIPPALPSPHRDSRRERLCTYAAVPGCTLTREALQHSRGCLARAGNINLLRGSVRWCTPTALSAWLLSSASKYRQPSATAHYVLRPCPRCPAAHPSTPPRPRRARRTHRFRGRAQRIAQAGLPAVKRAGEVQLHPVRVALRLGGER